MDEKNCLAVAHAFFKGFWGNKMKHSHAFQSVKGCFRPGGGGGYLTKFNTGRPLRKVQPLTLLYTILAEKIPLLLKKVPLPHTYFRKSCSHFHVVLNINKLKQPQGASIRKIIIKAPFKYLNDQFP